MLPLFETMGIMNTCRFSTSSAPSYFKEASAFEGYVNDANEYQRAKSDSAIRLDDSMQMEDPPGDLSLKPLGLIDSHRSDPDGQKVSHTDDFPSELDFKDVKKALKRLLQLGNKVYGRKLGLKEKRNELYHENKVLAEIDSRFIKNVRQFREDPKEVLGDSIYNQLDSQRDVIGSLQYEYDQAENDYDIYENRFEQEENTVLELLTRLLRLVSNGEDEEESTSDSSSNSHPLHIEAEFGGPTDAQKARLLEYENRIGDARIVQEQLQDLRFEQDRRLSISKKREKFGVGRNASDTSETFELRYTEVAKELSIINDDVQRLQEALQLDGHSFPELSTSEGTDIVPVDPQPQTPSFSTQLRKARSASETKMPLLKEKLAILHHRISRWIFVTFGDSPVEHVRHKVILGDFCSLDDDTWAHVVPEYWIDEAGTPEEGFHPPMLRSGTLKAAEAMRAFEREFPLTEAPKNRATPYNDDKLDFDSLSQYECRSN